MRNEWTNDGWKRITGELYNKHITASLFVIQSSNGERQSEEHRANGNKTRICCCCCCSISSNFYNYRFFPHSFIVSVHHNNKICFCIKVSNNTKACMLRSSHQIIVYIKSDELYRWRVMTFYLTGDEPILNNEHPIYALINYSRIHQSPYILFRLMHHVEKTRLKTSTRAIVKPL